MHIERLVTMANDIAGYFASEPDHAAAVDGVRNHLTRFWDPAMRRQLKNFVDEGGQGLLPLANDAVQSMSVPAAVD